MSRHYRSFLFLSFGLVLSNPSFAQNGAIPPLSPQQILDADKNSKNDAIFKGATALPSELIRGAGVLQHQMGEGGALQIIQGANGASKIISYGVSGAKIVEGTVKDGKEGFYRESTQFVLEKGIDAAAQVGVQIATGAAVVGGAAVATAAGTAGISYAAGSTFGTYLRNNATLGQSIGLRGPIGDEVDGFYFNHTPDSVKEWASGTKQVNVDDPAVMQKMLDDARRNRKQATFDAIQRENLEQQKQLAASRPAVSGELSAHPLPAPSGETSGIAIMQSILNASNAQSRNKSPLVSQAAASAPRACRLDPTTGCHSGHNEQSHPGGCKKC